MTCQHYNCISLQYDFLSPHTKLQWACLRDGCIKVKKYVSREDLSHMTNKLNFEHKIMINCETLEIYCTECKVQIYDYLIEENSKLKSKKDKKLDSYSIRQILINNNEPQDILFAGNAQYPPSFQKQKQGLCGLKMNTLNSYINSMIQLLSTIPIISEMCEITNLNKIQNIFLRKMMQIIKIIWSGKYRIYNAYQLQKYLIQQDDNFRSYRNKNPRNLFYFIIKKLMQQFYFIQNPCKYRQIISNKFYQWKLSNSNRYYTLTKQILGGQCIFQNVCNICGKSNFNSNRFQCLKISYQKQIYHSIPINLYDLIQDSFNWRNNHSPLIKNIQQGKLQCQKCKVKIKQYYAFVKLPNHLIIQFGDQTQGLNVVLPDQIDLHKFSQEYIKNKVNACYIYQYIGAIFRRQKRYTAHIKHNITKKQYNICDEIITENEKTSNQIKLVIFKRISNPKNKPLLRNIISSFQVNINPIVPLPDYWVLYLKYNFTIQPLVNPFICMHGKIKNIDYLSKIKQGPQKLPIEVYQYLLQIFGGRKISQKPQQKCFQCQKIQNNITQIRNSQKQMAIFADKLSHKKDRVLINRKWLQSWKQFVYEPSKRGYRSFGNLRPKKIKNQVQNIEQKKNNGSLKKISPEVWYFLSKFYGGGPLISKVQIHPNVVLTSAVDLRYQTIQPIFKDLYQKQQEQTEIKSKNQGGKTSDITTIMIQEEQIQQIGEN